MPRWTQSSKVKVSGGNGPHWANGFKHLRRGNRPQTPGPAHGAAIVDPEHAQYMLDHTGCHGVQLGSSIERLAVEGPIEARAAAFKASRLPGRRQ